MAFVDSDKFHFEASANHEDQFKRVPASANPLVIGGNSAVTPLLVNKLLNQIFLSLRCTF